VAKVDPEGCVACATCVKLCPYGAPMINDLKKAEIQGATCMGCGSCAAECPARWCWRPSRTPRVASSQGLPSDQGGVDERGHAFVVGVEEDIGGSCWFSATSRCSRWPSRCFGGEPGNCQREHRCVQYKRKSRGHLPYRQGAGRIGGFSMARRVRCSSISLISTAGAAVDTGT
jgi:ferredoxin